MEKNMDETGCCNIDSADIRSQKMEQNIKNITERNRKGYVKLEAIKV